MWFKCAHAHADMHVMVDQRPPRLRWLAAAPGLHDCIQECVSSACKIGHDIGEHLLAV
jgi:hypothetical protein